MEELYIFIFTSSGIFVLASVVACIVHNIRKKKQLENNQIFIVTNTCVTPDSYVVPITPITSNTYTVPKNQVYIMPSAPPYEDQTRIYQIGVGGEGYRAPTKQIQYY